jgi:hypothetical protein
LVGIFVEGLFSPKRILLKGIGIEVRNVYFIIMTRLLNIYFSNAHSLGLYGQSIQVASNLYPLCTVANIFGDWLHGIDNRFRTFIRVGPWERLSSFGRFGYVEMIKCLTIENLLPYRLSTVYRYALFMVISSADGEPLPFMEVFSRLKTTMRNNFSQYGWQHNLWIESPPA